MQGGSYREPAPLPHLVGAIPSRAQSFQTRATAARLRAALQDPDGASCAVLTGTGGAGKTQLAADHARVAWANGALHVLVWITAGSRSAVLAGFAQAGVELCRASPADPEQAAQSFLAWLTPRIAAWPCRWLVVLDDVNDPGDLRGLWPPCSPYGRTLVTTRRREAAFIGPDRRMVDVGLYEPEEALNYMTAYLSAAGVHEVPGQLARLAAKLGYLPLALSQAAAYLVNAGLDCDQYHRQLNDRAKRLADLLPEGAALPDEQAFTVDAAWSLSVDRADQLHPVGLARPVLELASLLDPNGIPSHVLTSVPALRHLEAQLARRRRDAPQVTRTVRPTDVDAALRALFRLSLVDHTSAAGYRAVRVHQLIQRVTREGLSSEQSTQHARAAADALLASWPSIERDAALAQAMRANASALIDHAGKGRLFAPGVLDVLHRLGRSYGESGQTSAAISHFEHLVAAAGRRLGADHPDSLNVRHCLAHWRGQAGEAASARTAFEALLTDRLRVQGPHHADTLETRHQLADWQGYSGDPAGAEAAFEALLADRLRLLGGDAPQTMQTRHKLVWWQWENRSAHAVVQELTTLLSDCGRVLGNDHPQTLDTLHDLIAAWWETGEVAKALRAAEQLLADRLRVQGPDHPHTLDLRHNLAHLHGENGDKAGERAAFEALLTDRLRVQGPDHPHTLTTRGSLARLRGEAGDPEGAATAYAGILADRLRIQGPDHLDTHETRKKTEYWRRVAEGQDTERA
ncbi:tetratricopeptide repeat protein [Streptomyces sp. MUM 178J]|uniref:tetratricopeptide repeat protein n=1 Tax=Streptomyces sp. MUM 178J TaxID=2791991 RepID=UPI001F034323|nr:tetratricopeptide repeat protein [Streptomyces sp. MUM 178J]WRQ83189.1 tetratricopeptide repeat protein [Streptomyces sp. MUM 178J]